MKLIQLGSSTISGSSVKTVNARDLHGFLESKADFSTWIKAQIDRARLVENRDFVKLHKKVELSKTGQVRTEYHLTIDAGKHISMMSGTDKGFEVRDYFLECEQAAQHAALNPANMSRLQLLELAMQAEQERLLLSEKVDVLQPKADVADRIAFSDGSYTLRAAAKVLQMAEQRFIRTLHARNWIYRQGGTGPWLPYSEKQKAGYLTVKTYLHEAGDGSEKSRPQTLITPLGMIRLASLLNKRQPEFEFQAAA